MLEASKSSSAYDTLIRARDKITRLNGIITPESVDKLEDELGGPLFNRERNQTNLTELGRIMLPHLMAQLTTFKT